MASPIADDPTPLDFNQSLNQNMNELTQSEKRIASLIRNNWDDAAFLSAGKIAASLNISEATVVRFARKLGYPSYPALRANLQHSYRQRMTHSARLRTKLDHLRDSGDLFERLTVSEIDYLTEAMITVDRDQLNQAARLILERPRIYILGLGPSISLVDLMEVRLRRFGKEIIPLRSTGREVVESILGMNARDLLFTFCFLDLNPTLEFILDHAREVGCPVIALTDTLATFLESRADVILFASRGPLLEFHSMVVPMNIINTLLLTFARENQQAVEVSLDQLDTLRARYKNYSSK
jgi:DNA-binding MurR/RpiR family transcriptional regulator